MKKVLFVATYRRGINPHTKNGGFAYIELKNYLGPVEDCPNGGVMYEAVELYGKLYDVRTVCSCELSTILAMDPVTRDYVRVR